VYLRYFYQQVSPLIFRFYLVYSVSRHQVAPPSWQEFLIIFVGLLLLLGFSSLAEHFFTKLWPNLKLDWCIEVIRNSGWICADEETLVGSIFVSWVSSHL